MLQRERGQGSVGLWDQAGWRMQFGRSGTKRRELSDINVTSLVDIIFNLLLFFLLTTTFSETSGLEIELPEASAADLEIAPDDLSIRLNAEGRVFIAEEELSLTELEARLQEHRRVAPSGAVVLQADTAVSHGRVAEVVDLAKRVGVARLGIATTAP